MMKRVTNIAEMHGQASENECRTWMAARGFLSARTTGDSNNLRGDFGRGFVLRRACHCTLAALVLFAAPVTARAELALANLRWAVESIVDNDDAPFGLGQGATGEPRSVRGLAVSPDGAYLYLAYNQHKQVRKIALNVPNPADSCDAVAELHFDGSRCSTGGYTGTCLPDSLDNPKAVATDDVGRVYATRSTEIHIFDANLTGRLLAITGFATTNGVDVRRLDAGNVLLYASDRGTDQLYRMVVSEATIAAGGSITRASVLDATFDGDGVVHVGTDAAGAATNNLRGLTADVDGNVWAAESDGTLFHVVPAPGDGASTVTKRALSGAFDVAIDGDQVFVSSSARGVTVIDRNDINTVIGTLSTPTGARGLAPAGSAAGIDVLSGAAIFVAIEGGTSSPASSESSFNNTNCGGSDPFSYSDDDNDPILVAKVVTCPSARYVATTGDDYLGSNDCTDPAAPCKMIQHAIDEACVGDTINVAGGVYEQTNITVTKSLTLRGDTSGSCPGPGAAAPEIVGSFTGSERGFIIGSGIDDVTIEGFVIRDLGVVPQIEAGGACGIWAYDTTTDPTERVTVRNNAFRSIGWAHVFFYNEAQSAYNDIEVSCNTVDIGTPDYTGYGGNQYGIECTNCVNSTISDNDVSGGDIGVLLTAQTDTGQSMTAGNNTISGNTISDSAFGNIYTVPWSLGGAEPTLQNISIIGNHLSNSTTAIWVYNSGGSVVRDYTLTGNDITVTSPAGDGRAVVLNNVSGVSLFEDNEVRLVGTAPPAYFHGVDVGGATTQQWTIRKNVLVGGPAAGSDGAGIRSRSTLAAGAIVDIDCNRIERWATGVLSQGPNVAGLDANSISDNTVGLFNSGTGAVSAENNWWGCAAGPGNPGCDTVTGTGVDYTPWATFVPACVTCSDDVHCDDGLFCSGQETCSAGSCTAPSGDPCSGGAECADNCNESVDNCSEPAGTACTDDGNLCTTNACDGAGGCAATNNAVPCDDGAFCNGEDACAGGSCSQHTGDPCAGGDECADTCSEGADTCNELAGTPCTDDGNVCTTDACNGSGACSATNNSVSCDDAFFCNGTDTCSNGSCSVHAGDPCTGGTECADACNESVDSCNVEAGTPCTDDSIPCTTNTCDGNGACAADDKQFAALCPWGLAVRGDPQGADTIRTGTGAVLGGGLCSSRLVVGESSINDGSVVATDDSADVVIRIGLAAEITGDIVSGGGGAKGRPQGVALPYTDGITSLSGGSVTAKNDASGDYDLSGAHSLVAQCNDARQAYADVTAYLAALDSDLDAGAVRMETGQTSTLVAPHPGAVNVIDVDEIRGSTGTVLELDGGGDPDTAVVLRVAGRFEMRSDSSINLLGGLTPDRVLISVLGRKCFIGNTFQGAGTLLCSATRIRLGYDTLWSGAWYAGGRKLHVGERTELTYTPFQAF